MRRSHQSRGLTLIELLVVIGIIVLLIFVFLPSLTVNSRHASRRVRCSSNLRQIGQGIQMYANENGGAFPRAIDDGAGGPPTEYTGVNAPHPFKDGAPGPNDVTAAAFLLLRTQDLTPEVFICDSVADAEPWDFGGGGRTAQDVSNFPGRRFLTYSFANPYATPEARRAGFKLSYQLTSDFAIAADINPGGAAVTSVAPNAARQQMMQANTPNHDGDGQNVLYADGHVEFHSTPFCGMVRQTGQPGQSVRDNIYTYGAAWGGAAGVGVRGSPADALDSVLLPTALDGAQPAAAGVVEADQHAAMPWLWVGCAGVFTGAALFGAILRRPKAVILSPVGAN